MTVTKLTHFEKTGNPLISVILPVFSAVQSRQGLEGICGELKLQTFQDFEVIVVEGVSPNGRARNEGLKAARGRFLLFIDDSIQLAHNKIIENLISAFDGHYRKVGMSGASVLVHPKSNSGQRQYAFLRRIESAVVNSIKESNQVMHACMLILKSVYEEVGGESNDLITGTDNDLRTRVSAAGYAVVLAPDTWVYYSAPRSLKEMTAKSYVKGLGAAYAFIFFPQLFVASRYLQKILVKYPVLAPLHKIMVAVFHSFRPRFFLRPAALVCEWTVVAGYIAGCVRWLGKPRNLDGKRPDLMKM